jgi:mxaJ protein
VRVATLLCAATLLLTGGTRVRNELRICADPNNLPFSNAREEGFENRVAELLAAELDAELRYTWWAQRRGFFRNTLDAGLCDVVMGVPGDFERALTTRPYYRSTYVFVSRAGQGFDVGSFDDSLLGRARVGVHLVGDDYANPPPVHALARRGLVRNIVGFTLYGDYREPNPPARLVEAVARGDVDVAIVWGPLAGYFAGRLATPLAWAPVAPAAEAALRFTFAIAAGVRKDAADLRDRVQTALDRRAGDVDAILDAYGVPRARTP